MENETIEQSVILYLTNVKLFINILWKMSCNETSDFEIHIHGLIPGLVKIRGFRVDEVTLN